MSMIARNLCLMLVLGIGSATFGQQPGERFSQQSGERAAPHDHAAATAEVLKMRMVSIEVSIVELAEKPNPDETLDAESSQKLIARIRGLEAEGKLAGLTRVRLSTLENNVATSQSGARAAAVTGRTGFQGPRGGEGPASTPILQMRDFGTLISATPRIEPGDTIVMELQIEKSSPVGDVRPGNAEPVRPEGTVPGKTATTTFRSTVRVTNGQTIILQGSGSSSLLDGASRTVILLTARAEKAPNVADAKIQPAQAGHEFHVFHLETASAEDVLELMRKLYANNRMKIACDVRTNMLLVSGSPEDLKHVEALVKLLDSTPARNAGAKPKAE